MARERQKRNACKILVGNPEGKSPLGRPNSRWEDNIKMDLKEDDDVHRIHVAQDGGHSRDFFVTVMNLRIPLTC
jgi:hypothetical protein